MSTSAAVTHIGWLIMRITMCMFSRRVYRTQPVSRGTQQPRAGLEAAIASLAPYHMTTAYPLQNYDTWPIPLSWTANCNSRLTSLPFVEATATSCVSYGRLPNHCLKLAVKHWSRRSFSVVWTTATLCYSTCPKDWWTGCSRFRTPSPAWLLVVDSTFRPHNAGAPSATLATGTPARWLQGCDARSSVAVCHFATVPIADDCRLVGDTREPRLRSTCSIE